MIETEDGHGRASTAGDAKDDAASGDGFVAWLHIGDLHASDEDGWASLDALRRIVAELGREVADGALDFAFLPGDNANHGTADQYRRIVDALAGLTMPLHAIPGDHDFEAGSLALFDEYLGRTALPAAIAIDGRRCIFLDAVSAGGGGPDFRLGDRQESWLADELARAVRRGEPRPVVFMHAFPEDFAAGGDVLARRLADAEVPLVDTGHTHYNELLNDGRVVYAATRSTGQVEEGPVGYSIAAVDGVVPSWRFRTLDAPWPFVLITSPADTRLTVARHAPRASSSLVVHALVLGRDVVSVDARIDDGPRVAMRPDPGRAERWSATLPCTLDDGDHRVVVAATDASGVEQRDEIELRIGVAATVSALGSHGAAIGAWHGRDVLGTRLGPNANGKRW